MIRIFPLNQLETCGIDEASIINELKDFSSEFNLEDTIGECIYFRSGKDAIKAIFEHLKLKREDEVYITTTTDSSYVSTCVSATVFNYCKISRVLTKKTKCIFLIHTFCFPHPQLLELRELADTLNIPLIEDCISAFDSYNKNGIRLGSIGDYAIYSLPKIIPIKYGGILTSKKNDLNGIKDDFLSKKIYTWVPYINELKKRRRSNYFYLMNLLSNMIYDEDTNFNPFMYGFYCDNYLDILSYQNIEFGLTHVKKEVHIPVSSFFLYNNEPEIFEPITKLINL